MKVIEGIENIDEKYSNLCIALGTFDGVHFGHQNVIQSAIDKAKELNGIAMVFTFSPHPLDIIASKTGPKLINSKDEKIKILESMGVDVLLFANFTIEFSELHPEEFIKNILKGLLNVKELFIGFNYTFGKDGIGNANFLGEISKRYGVKINVSKPVKIDGEIVSSTLIRELISTGKLKEVQKYLSYEYSICGKVIHGKKLASKLGFPTANLKIVNKTYPPYGVYGVKVRIEGEEKVYDGVMNIGENPTLKPGEHSVEVYIFDFNERIYDKKIDIKVMEFMRVEEKYNNVEDLVKQVKLDITNWKESLECH